MEDKRYAFDSERCLKMKDEMKAFSKITDIWKNHGAPSTIIGNCTNLFRLLKPTSHYDFYEKYLAYAEEHPDLPIKERGLTYKEIYDLAVDLRHRYLKEGGEKTDFSVEDYFYCVVCHIIVETYNGQVAEKELKDYLSEKKGYEIELVDGSVDAKYGIDFIIKKGKVKKAVQVKPISFFARYTKNVDLYRDQQNLLKKYDATLKDFGLETIFSVYKLNKATGEALWLADDKGKYSFKKDYFYKNGRVGYFKQNFQKLK